MTVDPKEICALVVSDVSNPLGVLLIPRSLATQEVLTTVMDAAEEVDQFVTQISPTICGSMEEVRLCIQQLDGVKGSRLSPGKPPA